MDDKTFDIAKIELKLIEKKKIFPNQDEFEENLKKIFEERRRKK